MQGRQEYPVSSVQENQMMCEIAQDTTLSQFSTIIYNPLKSNKIQTLQKIQQERFFQKRAESHTERAIPHIFRNLQNEYMPYLLVFTSLAWFLMYI
jgi:hypothetical protein